jgi:hypothetical protein
MANWSQEVYKSEADLHAAVEAIATTVEIKVTAFMEGGLQKFLLIKSA